MNTTTRPFLFKDKLRAELDRQALGISTLARRFAPEVHTKEFDSARRAIHKHLSGAAVPNRATRRRYEQLLQIEIGSLEPDEEEGDLVATLMTALQRYVREEVRSAA